MMPMKSTSKRGSSTASSMNDAPRRRSACGRRGARAFPQPSFAEGDLHDGVTVLEATVIGIETARPGEGEGRCDDDGVGGVAAAVAGEVERRGREVERALEAEGAAPGNGV